MFDRMISKGIFSVLTEQHTYSVIMACIFCFSTVKAIGLICGNNTVLSDLALSGSTDAQLSQKPIEP